MSAPWPLATLAEANAAFMERDESQIILGYVHSGCREGVVSGECAQAATSPTEDT